PGGNGGRRTNGILPIFVLGELVLPLGRDGYWLIVLSRIPDPPDVLAPLLLGSVGNPVLFVEPVRGAARPGLFPRRIAGDLGQLLCLQVIEIDFGNFLVLSGKNDL